MSAKLMKVDAPEHFDRDHYAHKASIKLEKCAGDWSGVSNSGVMKRSAQLELVTALRGELNDGGLRSGFYSAGRYILQVCWAASNECSVELYAAHYWPECYSKR